MRRLVAFLCAVGLVVGSGAPSAVAEDEIIYLDAVDLFFDESTGNLLEPGGGGLVELDFDTDTILDFQDLVDTQAWDVPEFLRDEALSFLFDEIALLVELEAISMTPQLATIHDAYAAELDGLDREELVSGLLQVDQILDQIKGDVAGHLAGPVPPVVIDAVGDLKPAWRANIASGGPPIPAGPYVGALSLLMSQGTATELGPDEMGVEFVGLQRRVEFLSLPQLLADLVENGGVAFEADGPEFGAAVSPESPGSLADAGTAAAPETVGGTAAAPLVVDDGGDLPMMLVVPAIALVGVAGVAVAWRRRRPAAVDVSDAVRRLINADSETAVAKIACGEAAVVTEARHAVLCRPTGGGLRTAGTPTVVVGSALQRVVETGTPLSVTVSEDPLLGPDEASVLAVPVITAGAVVGVLGVTRDGATFDADDRTALEQIAPAAAAALVNVDRLGSMTQLAHVDELTSLGNRRRLDRDLDATMRRAREDGAPVAFAMVDVDHFKTFNDTHGHAAGDAALRTVAAIIATNVREQDVVYRYGGEEFSILLPEATADEAASVAERVRRAVEEASIPGEETQPDGTLTVSVGVSTVPTVDPSAIAERADQALYDAKQSGRNRVVLSGSVS